MVLRHTPVLFRPGQHRRYGGQPVVGLALARRPRDRLAPFEEIADDAQILSKTGMGITFRTSSSGLRRASPRYSAWVDVAELLFELDRQGVGAYEADEVVAVGAGSS